MQYHLQIQGIGIALVFKVANQFPYQLSVKYAHQLKFSWRLCQVSHKSENVFHSNGAALKDDEMWNSMKLNLNKLSSKCRNAGNQAPKVIYYHVMNV